MYVILKVSRIYNCFIKFMHIVGLIQPNPLMSGLNRVRLKGKFCSTKPTI